MSQEKEEKKKLVAQYTEVYGKAPFAGWDAEKLKSMIAEKQTGETSTSPTNVEQPIQTEQVPMVPEQPKVQTAKKANPVMDFVIDPNQEYEFVLQKRKQARHNIPTTAKVWDEGTDTLREIRYVRTEASPYVDEQSKDSKVEREQIRFASPTLSVRGSETAKIRYLLAYDANGDKAKIWHTNTPIKDLYRLKDVSAEQKAELTFEKAKVDAGNIVTEANIADLSNFMRSRFNEKGTEDYVRLKAYEKAKTQPTLFTTDFTNPKHKIKAKIQLAVDDGLIKAEGNEIKYSKTNSLITTFDSSRYEFDEALARWILAGSKEAKEFQSVIEDKSK